MNRRTAIKSIAALPFVASVASNLPTLPTHLSNCPHIRLNHEARCCLDCGMTARSLFFKLSANTREWDGKYDDLQRIVGRLNRKHWGTLFPS